MELLLMLVLFAAGFASGTVLTLAGRHSRPLSAPEKPRQHGLYGEYQTSHWFRQRELETDPYWRTMPLRTYMNEKKRQAQEDVQ